MLLSVYIGKKMAGRFEGLSDIEWKLFEDIFPQQPKNRGKGMPHTPRTICTKYSSLHINNRLSLV